MSYRVNDTEKRKAQQSKSPISRSDQKNKQKTKMVKISYKFEIRNLKNDE